MLYLWVKELNIRDRVYVNIKLDTEVNIKRKQSVLGLNAIFRGHLNLHTMLVFCNRP